MDTLDTTEWDVVISGTGLPQSLLALALSRSSKKILHVDRNDYYGGNEAAFSLTEAETWAAKLNDVGEDSAATFGQASIHKPSHAETEEKSRLGFSRAYSLTFSPQLIYARSNLLPTLVSSRTHSQLDFQAVGSCFTVTGSPDAPDAQPKLTRVPNGREDIFQDNTLNLKAKRSLMKFLRFVGSYDEESEHQRWNEIIKQNALSSLKEQYGIPDAAVAPLLALALTADSASNTSMATVVPRIARHLRSIGLFGSGFSAVLPKWGGLAEISQVACRACAVGGGVYVLNKGIRSVASEGDPLVLELSDDEKIETKWLVGCPDELPSSGLTSSSPTNAGSSAITRSILIVSSPMAALFPPTSEGGVTPAGAVITVSVRDTSTPPVHILVHSSESGDCPAGQCVLYASTLGSCGFETLNNAVMSLLQTLHTDGEIQPEMLWSMQYVQRMHTSSPHASGTKGRDERVVVLPPLSTDVVLGDSVLEDVKNAWMRITGEEAEGFMKFEAREGAGGEEEE
ncbi:hypothetical protein LTR08_005189 [Meristemomyces frigidus]|nr:hypothetical protein LTR08_005189 [Meristemomyces frigidus]